MRGQVAILRRCRRCDAWLSIESFSPLGKLCNECMTWRKQPTDRIQSARGYALTEKGRGALVELATA